MSPLVIATSLTLCPRALHSAVTPPVLSSASSGCAPKLMMRSGEPAGAGCVETPRGCRNITAAKPSATQADRVMRHRLHAIPLAGAHWHGRTPAGGLSSKPIQGGRCASADTAGLRQAARRGRRGHGGRRTCRRGHAGDAGEGPHHRRQRPHQRRVRRAAAGACAPTSTTSSAASKDKADVQAVAVNDIWEKRKKLARERAGVEEKAVYHDYRELCARPDIDVVVDQLARSLALRPHDGGPAEPARTSISRSR